MEANGRERRWGPLSRASAWRAGTFWEDMEGEVRVYIEEDSERKEVEVEKRIEGGKESFWPKERKPHSQQEPDDDESAAEAADAMEVEAPEEMHVQQMMWLCEKVATLEKVNDEMKRMIGEMEAKIAAQEEAKKEDAQRRVAMECAIVEIAENL